MNDVKFLIMQTSNGRKKLIGLLFKISFFTTAVYSSCSDWVAYEIEKAVSMNKPILGVNPWAQKHYSQIVKTNANKIVGWQEKSVQTAIKELTK